MYCFEIVPTNDVSSNSNRNEPTMPAIDDIGEALTIDRESEDSTVRHNLQVL